MRMLEDHSYNPYQPVKALAGMTPKNFKNYIQHLLDARFLILLILILSLLVLTPFLDEFIETRILMDVFLTAIFIFIIYSIRLKRSQAIIAFVLVLPLMNASPVLSATSKRE